jgi:shikimate kinase
LCEKQALRASPSGVVFEKAMSGLKRTVALVGMMGAGKSAVGKRLAAKLGVPFRDADEEIEAAAGCSVSEIFERFGEPAFRDGERKVIARLLGEAPHVLATGGGAFINEETRARIKEGATSVWLKVPLDTLVARVGRRDTRPLLRNGDPREILEKLLKDREPIYAQADLTVDSEEGPHASAVDRILSALHERGDAP